MSKLEIPETWAETKLGAVCAKMKQEKPSQEFDYIDIESVNNVSNIVESPKRISPKSAPGRARKPVQLGDVVFSTVRPYLKNIAIVPQLNNPVASTGFCVLRSEMLSSGYLFNYVRSPAFLKLMESKQKGASYPAVSDGIVMDAHVPIPPKQEQHRIVSKIESCFSRIDAIEECVSKAEMLLESYRASLLAKAFRGGLVAQDPKDEPASILLGRIRVERDKVNAGKKSKKDQLPPITADLIPFKIPKTWAWVRLGEIAEFISGYAFKSGDFSEKHNGIQLVRIGNVTPDGLNLVKSPAFLPQHFATDYAPFLLRRGDLLVSLTGTIGKEDFGNAVVVDTDIPLLLNQRVLAIRSSCSEFLEKYFETRGFLNQFFRIAKGQRQANVSVVELREILVPLAPTHEQERILSCLSEKLKRTDMSQDVCASIVSHNEILKKAILDAAFSGQLVDQKNMEGTGHELLAQLTSAPESETTARTGKRKVKAVHDQQRTT